MRDFHSNVKVVEALRAASRTADANGENVNLRGYEGCEFAVAFGTSLDSLSGSNTIAIEMQEADDNGSGAPGSYSPVAASDIIGGNGGGSGQCLLIDSTNKDEAVYRFGYIGRKEWVRLVYNVTGTHSSGTPCAAVAILGMPRHAPVADQKV